MNKIFRKFLRHVGYGIGQAMVISAGRAYVRPAEKSFRIDAANLRNDAINIGRKLNKKFKR